MSLPDDGAALVWTVDLDRPVDVSSLSADEISRAARFHQEVHRRRFAAGRATLRAILAGYAGMAPAALAFTYGANGKPSLDGGPHFNIAHTGAVAMIALAAAPVGIDVERIDPDLDIDAIGEVAFAPEEVAAVRALPESVRARGFYHVWTSREALVKGLGLGLSMPVADVLVCADPSVPPKILRGAAGWRLEALSAPPGHVAALAVAVGSGASPPPMPWAG